MDRWDLRIDRTDLTRTELVEAPAVDLASGQALLRTSTVGITANNVTYGVMGDAMRYWSHFPADPPWGRIPLWGFADVEESTTEGLEVGERVYGYLPTSSHVVVTPDRLTPAGFRDASPHRAGLPGAYMAYERTAADPAYDADREGVAVLYRPLLLTAFVLDDWLGQEVLPEVDQVVVVSASSRTAYATALQTAARPDRPRLVGLTSSANVDFVAGLGCYDLVLAYGDVVTIPVQATVVVDMAGAGDLRRTLHTFLGEALRRDVMVGVTHQSTQPPGDLPGVAPEVFFAPDQIRRIAGAIGMDGLTRRVAEAWAILLPVVSQAVTITEHHGPEGLDEAWRTAVAGGARPDQGLIVRM